MAFSWALMFLTLFCVVLYSMMFDKTALAQNVTAVKDLLGASWELWGVALTILGYTIKKRTEDKHVAAGDQGSGILDRFLGTTKK